MKTKCLIDIKKVAMQNKINGLKIRLYFHHAKKSFLIFVLLVLG